MHLAKSVVNGISVGSAILVSMYFNTKHIATVWLLVAFFIIVFAAITAYYFIEMHEASQRDDKK